MPTILVVEDSITNQRMLEFTLQLKGYKVLKANHGKEALAVLETARVDLVISDVAMPEMDGLTLLQHLREEEKYHTLPIIILTASGKERDRLEATARGANAFLTKPSSSREIINTVNQVLSG